MRISLLRRAAALATTLGLTSLGLLGAGAAPAQAAVSDCPSGYFCAWRTGDGTGSMFKTNASKATLGTWDNSFNTVINRTSLTTCLYDDANYGLARGYSTYEPRETYATSMDPYASSLKLVRTVRECEGPAYPYWYAPTVPKLSGFGDMNADRRSDMLVRDRAGRLWFLPGDNTGRLVGTGGWNAMNALTRHGDFSRDGREDVIAREASTGKLWLYPGTGTGGLGSRKLVGTGGWNGMSEVTAFGDLSGDGRADLVAVEKSTGKLWLYPGTSAGGLGARKLIGTGGWNGMRALVGAGDMNSDGRADLVAVEKSTGKLWLYPGKAGYLGSRVLIGTGGWNAMSSLTAVGDWSADGHGDLLAKSGDWLVQYQGLGTGGLRPGEWNNASWWGLDNGGF
ncbi:VCBS repeat-containing protein [Streptomyces actuosus]|uniref:VCBS repeat-containing protein n=1 Tax=Streptomyces actuosus TaxID=1885 RepID=A0ABS2VV22_STRAS|nr:FG-GAP-like repeat-containing protein [Streptomyces actuosus]MBN0046990.1 VCBS repeat-containing protein [Streptomyces actuosus]